MTGPGPVPANTEAGHTCEVLAAYPYRSACPAPVWGRLIADATQDVLLAGYTNYFVWLEQTALHETLRRKARAGCRVRFLLGDPDSQTTRRRERVENAERSVSARIRITLEHLEHLRETEGVEARFSAPDDGPNHVGLSVFRFDHDILLTPHLASTAGHDSPMLHLRRAHDGGMFDRFAEHAEQLWERGVPTR